MHQGGDLQAATRGVRECGRGRTTDVVPVAEIVVWAETVWEELLLDVDRVPSRAGIQSINQRRACVHKDGQQPVLLCERMVRRHHILQSGRNLKDDVREAERSKVHNRRKVAVDGVTWHGSQLH